MNYLGFAALIMSITLNSCEKDEKEYSNKCNVSNPAEEIDWLKEAISDVKQDEYSYLCYGYF